MIQVELSVLVHMFYLMGQREEYPKGDTAVLVNSLDQWQKNELFNSWRKGKEESLHKEVLTT